MGMMNNIPKSFLQHLLYVLRDERGEFTPGGSGGSGDGGGDNPGDKGGDAGDKGDNGGSGGNPGDGDHGDKKGGSEGQEPKGLDKLDEETRNYIKGLRSENARYRTEAKSAKEEHIALKNRFNSFETNMKKALGLESDDDNASPEEQVGALQATVEELQFRNAINDMALEEGLNRKQSGYLGYLIQQEQDSLEEGGEIADERMAELVSEAKSIGGAGGAAGGSTSPSGTGDGQKKKPAPQGGGGGEVTSDQFTKMSTTEKTELYRNNPDLYDKLYKEARAKRTL